MEKCNLIPLFLGAAALGAWAQDPPPVSPPPVLEYSGKPLPLSFKCTEEDMQFGGLSCPEEDPCPIYLELSAVEPVGNRIFAAGNLHSSAVTLYSVLLASEDGGRTWREAHERIRGALLDHIQFLDPETGWTSGHSVSPLPQDPFLLRTTDGGRTWRQRPVFSESAENHLGAIHQFLFASKNSGSLIIDRGQGSDEDRYELYESSDGGESWNIKQSSRNLLRLKNAPTVATDWRLRADGRSKAFHVEHKQGERWETVASFLVPAGVCKPAPPAEAPPAVPDATAVPAGKKQ